MENVRKNFDGFGDVVLEGFGVVDGVFSLYELALVQRSRPRSVVVQMCRRSSGHPCFQFPTLAGVVIGSWCPTRDDVRPGLSRIIAIGSHLEGQVLQEVCCAVALIGFRSTSTVNPYTYIPSALHPVFEIAYAQPTNCGGLLSRIRFSCNLCPNQPVFPTNISSIAHTVNPLASVVVSVL